MISIVNRTVFTNSNSTGDQSVTIPATTAGNTLLVASMCPGGQGANSVYLGASFMTRYFFSYGNQFSVLYPISGGQTTVTFKASGGQQYTAAAVIYELTPCTVPTAATGTTPTPGATEAGPSLTEAANAAFFAEALQDIVGAWTYNSVNSPWTMDYVNNALPETFYGSGIGSVAYVLNATGTYTATWNLSTGTSSNHQGILGIVLLDSNPGPSVTPTSLAYVNRVWGFKPAMGDGQAGDGTCYAQSLAITASGDWSVTTDVPWLQVTPSSGTGNGTVTVNLLDTGLPRDSFGRTRSTASLKTYPPVVAPYTGTVTVTSSGGSASATVSYSVGYGGQLGS